MTGGAILQSRPILLQGLLLVTVGTCAMHGLQIAHGPRKVHGGFVHALPPGVFLVAVEASLGIPRRLRLAFSMALNATLVLGEYPSQPLLLSYQGLVPLVVEDPGRLYHVTMTS
jgi:hypothetical protein